MKKKSLSTYLFGILLVMLTFSSCVTTRRVNYMQEPDRRIPSYADTLSYEEYTIRIGDRLYVYVYSLDESIMKLYNAGSTNSGYYRQQMMGNGGNSQYGSQELYSYLVDAEGNIDFPTIGKIHVHGLTTREVKRLLEKEIGTLLKDLPGFSTVSCEVNIVQRSFSLIGMKSGRYNITKEKMTIFEAIASAGDVDDYGDKARVKIVREIDGVTTIREFDLRSKDIINSEYYYVEPNDIIYIRRFNGYSFGMNHFTSGFAIVTTTLSFGMFVYTIVQTGINHVNKYKK